MYLLLFIYLFYLFIYLFLFLFYSILLLFIYSFFFHFSSISFFILSFPIYSILFVFSLIISFYLSFIDQFLFIYCDLSLVYSIFGLFLPLFPPLPLPSFASLREERQLKDSITEVTRKKLFSLSISLSLSLSLSFSLFLSLSQDNIILLLFASFYHCFHDYCSSELVNCLLPPSTSSSIPADQFYKPLCFLSFLLCLPH